MAPYNDGQETTAIPMENEEITTQTQPWTKWKTRPEIPKYKNNWNKKDTGMHITKCTKHCIIPRSLIKSIGQESQIKSRGHDRDQFERNKRKAGGWHRSDLSKQHIILKQFFLLLLGLILSFLTDMSLCWSQVSCKKMLAVICIMMVDVLVNKRCYTDDSFPPLL